MDCRLSDTEFYLKDAGDISYLYMPLVNEKIMSCITPDGHGDSKISQNHFLLEPVSVENLHSSMSSRNFWCVMEKDRVWSVFGYSAQQLGKDSEKSCVHMGAYWQRTERKEEETGLTASVLSFCPAGKEAAEIMLVTLENKGDEVLELTPVTAVPIYGRGADHLRDHRHVTSLLNRIQIKEDGILVTPSMAFDERGHHKNDLSYGVFARDEYGEKPEGAVPFVEDFIGEGGNLLAPKSLLNQEKDLQQPGYVCEGYEAMGALWFKKISLLPGEKHSYVVVLSYGEEGLCYLEMEKTMEAFRNMKDYWEQQKLITCQSSNKAFDSWISWISLQPHLRRIFGCSFLPYHDYGRGGRGWRDLWQDCLALILMDPGSVREDLGNFFAGVRIDGTNATIIGSRPGEFIADRNSIVRVWSDHAYWCFRTVSLYLEQTGDYAFLLEEKPYFKDRILYRGEKLEENPVEDKNVLLTKESKEYMGTVLEHLMLQNLAQFYEVGEHNHMRLRGADWNDALDMASQRGETVAFTAAYSGNFKEMADLFETLEARGIHSVKVFRELKMLLTKDTAVYEDQEKKREILKKYCQICQPRIAGETEDIAVKELAEIFRAMGEWISGHIRRTELTGDQKGNIWLNGYYDNLGRQAEGMKNNIVRMMLTSQVFTILSGTATDEQVEKVAKAAQEYLFCPKAGGYRLNTDFKENDMNLGRMFGFAYGHKENGAVFSHMTVMYAYALYSRNFIKEGYQAIKALSDQSLDFGTSFLYPGIPEYFSPRGRGMYPYLTGAASWLILTVLTQMFGITGEKGNLKISPKLLAEQFGEEGIAEVNCRFAGRKKIRGEIEASGGSGNGIGLKNVQDRIKIQFGDKYYKTCSKLYASSTRSISAYFPGVREPV